MHLFLYGNMENSWYLNSDLTSALNGFNDGKTAPLTLGGTIAETPDEAGFTGEITDWETVDGGGVDAEM